MRILVRLWLEKCFERTIEACYQLHHLVTFPTQFAFLMHAIFDARQLYVGLCWKPSCFSTFSEENDAQRYAASRRRLVSLRVFCKINLCSTIHGHPWNLPSARRWCKSHFMLIAIDNANQMEIPSTLVFCCFRASLFWPASMLYVTLSLLGISSFTSKKYKLQRHCRIENCQ